MRKYLPEHQGYPPASAALPLLLKSIRFEVRVHQLSGVYGAVVRYMDTGTGA